MKFELKDQMAQSKQEIKDRFQAYESKMAPDWFQVFGPKANRLTPKAHEKLNEMMKFCTSQIDAENRQRDLEFQKQRKVLIDSMDGSYQD